MTDQTCEKWFVKLCAADFLLDDAPWLSRPLKVDSDQSETLTGSSQCSTMPETAAILNTSKSIKLLVKMKKICILFYGKKHIWAFWPTQ